jgi:uncharacterized protein YeaO (DUF488 family)
MKIKIKRVYEPAERGDRTRVLVDRFWPRGVSKDDVPVWLKDVAPSNTLRSWYGHVPERWVSYRAKYRKELAANPDAVLKLKSLTKRGIVTLVYGPRDTKRNQAVVLAEFLQSHESRPKPRRPA